LQQSYLMTQCGTPPSNGISDKATFPKQTKPSTTMSSPVGNSNNQNWTNPMIGVRSFDDSQPRRMESPTTSRWNHNARDNNKSFECNEYIPHRKNNNSFNNERPLEPQNYSHPIPHHPPYCVWLGNMPSRATNKHVSEYFEQMGIAVKDIRWGRRLGAHTCCYVDFYNVENMKTALQTIDSIHSPRFMRRWLKIDINEGIRMDRESAVAAVAKRPLKIQNRYIAESECDNNEIFITTTDHGRRCKSIRDFISDPLKCNE